MKQRVLVCGATGFIGRNCVERLVRRDGVEVIGVYNHRPPFSLDGLTWRKADLTKPEEVSSALDGIDVIVQAAATTSGSKDIVERPYIHITDNAVMNSYLMRDAYEKNINQFIFFSCTVMYASRNEPHDENSFDYSEPIKDNYFSGAWTKLYLEKMAEFYANLGTTRYTIVRHSNIYGPHDKFDLERSHVFGATVSKVLTAKDKVTIWGTGKEKRDLLYVDDLVDFVESAINMQESPFGLYCCGTGEPISIGDLTQLIIDRSNRSLGIEYDHGKPTIPINVSVNCMKANLELGWSPKTTLSDGIEKTLAWWREHCNFDSLRLPEKL